MNANAALMGLRDQALRDNEQLNTLRDAQVTAAWRARDEAQAMADRFKLQRDELFKHGVGQVLQPTAHLQPPSITDEMLHIMLLLNVLPAVIRVLENDPQEIARYASAIVDAAITELKARG